jgi:hypothetical protein
VAGKFLQSEEFLLHSPHKPFFGIALGIVIAGKDLLNIQMSGHFQEGTGTGLAAIGDKSGGKPGRTPKTKGVTN